MANALYKTNQSIPQDMLLGNLSFINLTDMTIPHTDLENIFQSNNIPVDYIRQISATDAFRRASSSIKNRVGYVDGNKVVVNVDEVKNDKHGIKRILGVKRVDDIAEDIQYESMAEIYFNRDNNTCSAIPMVGSTDPAYTMVSDLCDEVVDNYGDWSVFHNKDTVRNIVNRIIGDTHPISLMPTGLCKFIPSMSTDLLYNLKNALKEMSAFSGNSSENIMEIIPVIDTEEQRDLVEKNFKAEITEELFAFTQELKDVLQAKQSLSTRSAAAYIEKFNVLQAKAKEYEALLGIYIDSIYSQITEAVDLVNDNTTV